MQSSATVQDMAVYLGVRRFADVPTGGVAERGLQ